MEIENPLLVGQTFQTFVHRFRKHIHIFLRKERACLTYPDTMGRAADAFG